jgi:hypothetical protein
LGTGHIIQYVKRHTTFVVFVSERNNSNNYHQGVFDMMLKSLTKKLAPAAKVAGRVGFLLAPQLVLMAFGVYDHAAHAAGGLVGAAVDPAFGQANEVGMLADYGYDSARDISRVVTALSTVPSSMAGMKIAFGQRDGGESAMNVAKGLGVGFGAPTAVHLLGTFAINNFGGLGGGL